MEWKDITIGKFREIQHILAEDEPDLTKKIYIYALLSGELIEQVREYPLGQFLEKYSKLTEFMEYPIPQVIPKYWEHEGVKYKITSLIDSFTAGQYIDFKEFGKEKDNIHNVMAVLCYDGETYKGETHKKRAELFNEFMPITVAYPLTVFFLNVWSEWSEISLAYSKRVLKEQLLN